MRSKPKAILGISHGHGDSSACLIVNGRLVAAAEEERFVRKKHYALFPRQAIHYCLSHAGLRPNDVHALALAKKPWNAAWKKFLVFLQNPQLAARKKPGSTYDFKAELELAGLRHTPVFRFEHHLAHLMSARILSPSHKMALLSFDGLGDFVSAAIGVAEGSRIEIIDRIYFPKSLGFFYTALTQYLGFPYFGDEYKVMGLSSFGKSRFANALSEVIAPARGFDFDLNLQALPVTKNRDLFFLKDGQPYNSPLFQKEFLSNLIGFGPRNPKEPLRQEHKDLAKSIQVQFENVSNHLLREAYKIVPTEVLGLAGGCAHNSVWVGKVPKVSAFKNIFVAPAAHDAGIAVGAAALASGLNVSCEEKHWALLGPDETDAPFPSVDNLDTQVTESYPDDKHLCKLLAAQLAKGKIVGLFRGRMEFGPRALGSRSILCDPRLAEMKEILNLRVKHREKFRPFAASVLFEHQKHWFEDSFYAPTMEAVFPVKKAKQALIPAVVHADHSCRIQSIVRDYQPFYWELIEAFRQITEVPMLINTSFNDSEPIVCTPQDAINCFNNCNIDILVLGNRVISRTEVRAQPQNTLDLTPLESDAQTLKNQSDHCLRRF